VPGDVIFGLGGLMLAWIVFNLMINRPVEEANEASRLVDRKEVSHVMTRKSHD
jgi:hypothetical protein